MGAHWIRGRTGPDGRVPRLLVRKPTPLFLSEVLTNRDRSLLEDLFGHRVLTIHQIEEMYFTSGPVTRKRMLRLARLGVVLRFRPPALGSAPYQCALSAFGARVVAAPAGRGIQGAAVPAGGRGGASPPPRAASSRGDQRLLLALVLAFGPEMRTLAGIEAHPASTGGAASPEEEEALRRLGLRASRLGQLATLLLVVSLGTMAVARLA